MRLFAGLLLLVVGAANAAQIILAPPAVNADGSAIPATGPGSVVSVRFEYGTCVGSGFGSKLGELVLRPDITPELYLPPAGYCFRAYSKTTSGKEFARSKVFKYIVQISDPTLTAIGIEAAP